MKKLLAGLLSLIMTATIVATPLGECFSAVTSFADEVTSLKTWKSDASTKASPWYGFSCNDPFAFGGYKDNDGNPVEYPFYWSQAKSLEVKLLTATDNINGSFGVYTGSNFIWESVDWSINYDFDEEEWVLDGSDHKAIKVATAEALPGKGNVYTITYTDIPKILGATPSLGATAEFRINGFNRLGEKKAWLETTVDLISVLVKDSNGNVIFELPASEEVSPFIYEEIEEGTVSITRYIGTEESIIIPSEIDGKPVTSIGERAFDGCISLKSVIIPNSVTSIGEYAFEDCKSLTSITIPDSVTSIEYGAFESCTSLTSVTIGNSVTRIGERAFRECSRLTSVTIPDSVTSIGNEAFKFCYSLTSVIIPNSVTSIGDDAFYHCTSLTSITIGNSVTSIGSLAFGNCTSLTSITIGNSVTDIGEYAFWNCENLTSVIIPNSVTSIGDDAFYHCTSLTSITIGNSVTSIGEYAFGYCKSLKSVTIPNSVTRIGDYAFYHCTSLTSITIGNSVTSIENCAFESCSSLTDVYYLGTKEEWNKISIEAGNSWLENATIHYNYVEKPKTSTEFKTPDQFKNITLKNNKDFSNIYFDDKSFAIPGLINTYLDDEGCCDFMTPQGICKAGDYFIVTAYCGAKNKGTDTPHTHETRHNSVIYILDATTSKPSYITTINLKNKNHVGGIAYDPNNKLIWITGKSDDSKNQYMVDAISYNFIDNLVKSSNYKDINDAEYVAQNKNVTVKSSYLTYYNNMLWVGDNSKSRFAGYKINEDYSLTQATEITYFKETDKISIFGGNDKLATATNGMCFYDYNGKTYLGVTTSPGRSREATLYTYRVDFENKNNKYAIKLDNKATFQLPRMAEELEVVGDKTYINFESASSSYFSFDKANNRQPTDRICAVDTTELFSKTINSKKINFWTYIFKSNNKKSVKKARVNQYSQNETTSISSYSGNEENVVIPDTTTLDDVTYTVDSICSKAFEYNTNIKTITIPSTVTKIEKEAFADCPNLTAIKVSDDNPNYSSQDGALYSKDKTELIYVPEGLNSISIANSTETIVESAFLNSNISNVEIPEKVKTIGNYAFGNCKNLKEIVIPKNVTEIGVSALGYYFDVENESDEKVADFKIKTYHNSAGEKYAKDNEFDYELLDETTLEGKIYYQQNLKENSQLRFIAEVSIEDIEKANSGNYSVKIGDNEIIGDILKAYRSIKANGNIVKASEGKCFIITPVIKQVPQGADITSTFNLDTYDVGLTRQISI